MNVLLCRAIIRQLFLDAGRIPGRLHPRGLARLVPALSPQHFSNCSVWASSNSSVKAAIPRDWRFWRAVFKLSGADVSTSVQAAAFSYHLVASSLFQEPDESLLGSTTCRQGELLLPCFGSPCNSIRFFELGKSLVESSRPIEYGSEILEVEIVVGIQLTVRSARATGSE